MACDVALRDRIRQLVEEDGPPRGGKRPGCLVRRRLALARGRHGCRLRLFRLLRQLDKLLGHAAAHSRRLPAAAAVAAAAAAAVVVIVACVLFDIIALVLVRTTAACVPSFRRRLCFLPSIRAVTFDRRVSSLLRLACSLRLLTSIQPHLLLGLVDAAVHAVLLRLALWLFGRRVVVIQAQRRLRLEELRRQRRHRVECVPKARRSTPPSPASKSKLFFHAQLSLVMVALGWCRVISYLRRSDLIQDGTLPKLN